MLEKEDLQVLMVGPDLVLHGGIVSVIKGYLDGGIADHCKKFSYLGTGSGTSILGKSIAFVCSLCRFCLKLKKYKIIHIHISAKGSYFRKAVLVRIAKVAGKIVILHEHDGEFKKTFDSANRSFKNNIRNTFALADKVIVLSEEWKEYFTENICDSSKVVVIHNGVCIPKEKCNPSSHQDILFLGRLDNNKNPDMLFRASKKVLDLFPDSRLIIAGDGALEHCKRMVYELGILDRCSFLGWVPDESKEQLFYNSGIFCLTSKNEGLPMSLLEAMAHGLPAISTAVGGIPQVIDNGVTGYLIGVDDEASLTRILIDLLKSPKLRDDIGAAGRERIDKEFNFKKSLTELIALYSEFSH